MEIRRRGDRVWCKDTGLTADPGQGARRTETQGHGWIEQTAAHTVKTPRRDQQGEAVAERDEDDSLRAVGAVGT